MSSIDSKPIQPTPARDFGPFYVLGAPFRAKLSPIYCIPKTIDENATISKPGEAIRISGTIRGVDKQGALIDLLDKSITIDLWQASPEGDYDYQEKDGIFKPYLSCKRK
jgi:protocatechuate 3,4-dioxygenase beta subunit